MNKESLTAELIRRLLAAGWEREGILEHPIVSIGAIPTRADLALTHSLYPFGIVETVANRSPSEAGLEHAKRHSASLNLPFAMTWDGTAFTTVNLNTGNTIDLGHIPSPVELWRALGRKWDENDPRLYPAPAGYERQPGLLQAVAISRVTEAIVQGSKRILFSMAIGSGKSYVIVQVLAKLLGAGKVHRGLVIADARVLVEQFASQFSKANLSPYIWTKSQKPSPSSNVYIVTNHTLRTLGGSISDNFPADFFDLVIAEATGLQQQMTSYKEPDYTTLEYFRDPVFIGVTDSSPFSIQQLQFFGTPLFTISIQDALQENVVSIHAPEGYSAVQLDEIAELSVGVENLGSFMGQAKVDTSISTGPHYVISASDVNLDQELDVASLPKFTPTITVGDVLVKPGDIVLVPYLSSGSRTKLAIIPRDLPGPTIYQAPLVRIRPKPDTRNPQALYEFLMSETGQTELRLLATQSRLSIRDIGKMTVLMPKYLIGASAPIEGLSIVHQAIKNITAEILPALRAYGLGETGQPTELPSLELLAGRLKNLAAKLAQPSLSERVVSEYPTPIALSFRKFSEAKFNAYEQVFRLRDLYEATSFLIYNVVLADMIRRLDSTKYFVANTGARRAYNNYSMGARISCVETILDLATSNGGQDLFVPELAHSKFVQVARDLQDMRNAISHTAIASESRQRRLLTEYQPRVESLLAELGFLSTYRLARITGFFFSSGQLIMQSELYRGAIPTTQQETINSNELTYAERDHIVLLSPDNKVLDLHPLYQLVADEATRDESHLCFLKQRKIDRRELIGESVQGAFEVVLNGYDDFHNLQMKLQDDTRKPGAKRKGAS